MCINCFDLSKQQKKRRIKRKDFIICGSGLNDKRPKLEQILKSEDYSILLVEHKDRLTRFGFNYIETLLETKGIKIEIINEAIEEKADLIEDLVSIITSFCGRIYGRKRKEKTKEIIEKIKQKQVMK